MATAVVLFETSGQVRRALRAVGIDAVSVDRLPSQDRSVYHYQLDVAGLIQHWNGRGIYSVPDPLRERPRLAIAHPDCTFLCNSGVSRLTKTPPNPSPGKKYGAARWAEMRAAATMFADLLTMNVELIAIENPTMHGHARRAIADLLCERHGRPNDGRPTQFVQPFHFGDDASKNTGLWLRGLPPLVVPPRAEWCPPRLVCPKCRNVIAGSQEDRREGCQQCGASRLLPRWANQTDSGQNNLTPSDDRGLRRADTYPGIAKAFTQWKALL